MPILKIEDVTFEFEENLNVKEILKNTKKSSMPCGGHGKCGKCKVYAKGCFNPPTADELSLLTKSELEKGIRLACCLKAFGDGEIRIFEGISENVIISDGILPAITINPVFSRYGVAIDIGTTTVCARLYDSKGALLSESSRLNSQKRFGYDVVSRIEAQLSGKGKILSALVREDITSLILDMAKHAEINPGYIDRAVITGNTVMLHLLTNTDTTPLSCAPFTTKRLFGNILTAYEVGISALRGDAEIYIPPCISAFVGADMVCALLASEITDKEGIHLLADIGTNGEMALCKDGRLTVCSTAAGPAFEGVGIKCGVQGGKGAVDKVWLENGKIDFHVIGDESPAGICGSGIIDAVASLIKKGTVDKTGYMEKVFDICEDVFITPEDIRQIQLAKSAVFSGIETLLHFENVKTLEIGSVVICGGFGKTLNLYSAETIGLFPKGIKEKTKCIGNGAVMGAAMLLLSEEMLEKANEISKKAVTISLAESSFFTEEYIKNMMF